MDVPDEVLKSQSVEIKEMSAEEMDMAEMQVYGDVSREFRDYKVRVSKHNKKKAEVKQKNTKKGNGKEMQEVNLHVDKTLKEVVFKLKFS